MMTYLPQLPFPDDAAIAEFFRGTSDLSESRGGMQSILEDAVATAQGMEEFITALVGQIFTKDYQWGHRAEKAMYVSCSRLEMSRQTEGNFSFRPPLGIVPTIPGIPEHLHDFIHGFVLYTSLMEDFSFVNAAEFWTKASSSYFCEAAD